MAMIYILLVLITLENCCHAAPSNQTIPDDSKLKLELFYSPAHSGSCTLIKKSLCPVLRTDLGSCVDLTMSPVAYCKPGDTLTSRSCQKEIPVELALEHLCASEIKRGSFFESASEQYDRVTTHMDYVSCLIQDHTESPSKLINKCRKQLSATDLKAMQKCVNEKGRGHYARASRRYAKFNPRYCPFFVVNDTQSRQQDIKGFRNLVRMICDNIQRKPETCKNPTALSRDIDVGDVATKDLKGGGDKVVVEETSPNPSPNPTPSQSYSVRPRFLFMAIINLILFLLIHEISL